VDAMRRLIVYFAIQWFLGVLVRRNYLKATVKRITLTILILLQLKEAFYEEVLFDMVISMVMESGLMILLFFQFAHIVVALKIAALNWVIIAPLLFAMINGFYSLQSFNKYVDSMKNATQMFMYRIHNCRIHYAWNRLYC
jgi:hypothetical protein